MRADIMRLGWQSGYGMEGGCGFTDLVAEFG